MKTRSWLLPLAMAAAAGTSQAALIDFGGLSGVLPTPPALFPAFTSVIEDGFEVAVSQGTWQVAPLFGNPGPSIEAVGSGTAITVKAVDGGTFRFQSVDLTSVARGPSSVGWLITGTRLGADLFTQSGQTNGNGPLSPFTTEISNSPTLEFDTITIAFTSGNALAVVDNIVVQSTNQVPEPPTLLAAAAGLALAGLMRSRRRG